MVKSQQEAFEMRVAIIYESMFGNTHTVAEHIGAGMGDGVDAVVIPVGEADDEILAGLDMVVVGGPTHVHGMTSKTSRKNAVDVAADEPDLDLDPDAEGPGLRDWFGDLTTSGGLRAAAFDTRIDASPVLTGRASKGIARRLRHHGFELAAQPMSFLVDKESHLEDGEAEKARQWGANLVASLQKQSDPTSAS